MSACNFESKKIATDRAIELSSQIKGLMSFGNVDKEVDELKYIFENCKVDMSSFGLGRGVFDFWKKEGHKAEKKNCSYVRLDDPGGPMENMPTMDQGKTGMCYAFTAAQMIDAWRFAHGDPKTEHLTSPLQMAALFKHHYPKPKIKTNPASTLRAGSSTHNIDLALKFGSCSNQRTKEMLSIDDTQEKITRLVNSYNTVNETSSHAESETRKILCNFFSETTSSSELLKLAQQIKNSLNSKNAQSYLFELIDLMCTPPHHISVKPDAKNISFLSLEKSELEHKKNIPFIFNQALEGKPASAATISYCSDVLKDKKSKTMHVKDGKIQKDCNNNHASIIIGHRLNPNSGTCQYLLRNSWGSSCNSYDWESDKGNVWLDKSAIISNTYKASRLEKK